jgi:uncharacterized protein (DUF488 family)
VKVRLFTIGFAETTAEQFFSLLKAASVKRVVDIRLNNTSQLAGFSKRDDLRYFLRKLAGIDYVHLDALAPTQPMLDSIKKHKGSWTDFERGFRALMVSRKVENVLTREVADPGCLLYSEKEPHHYHRRLVAEHIAKKWGDVLTNHLG